MLARFWFYFYCNYVFGWMLCINGYAFCQEGGWWAVLGLGTILSGVFMIYEASVWYRVIRLLEQEILKKTTNAQ